MEIKMKELEVSLSKKQNQESYWISIKKLNTEIYRFNVKDKDLGTDFFNVISEILNVIKHDME